MTAEQNPAQNQEKREDHHLVSPTAKLVAHLRADTDIPYSREIDKICEAGETTERLFGKKEALSWMASMLELRYKSLSALLEKELSEQGIKQVLELACGIQPRGLIMSSDPEIRYIETDLSEMAKEKRSLVSEIDSSATDRPNYSIAELNVLDGGRLLEVLSNFDDGPIAIINEGLLPYLSIPEKSIAVANIHRALSERGGVWITPDISNSGRMRKIIELFPGGAEAVQKISEATGRMLKNNSIGGGDKDATLKFYRDAGFEIAEYKQRDFVPTICTLDAIADTATREAVDSMLDESNIWVLRAIDIIPSI